jgi:hypothetical protein
VQIAGVQNGTRGFLNVKPGNHELVVGVKFANAAASQSQIVVVKSGEITPANYTFAKP